MQVVRKIRPGFQVEVFLFLYGAFVPPIFTSFLPHFRLYGVVSLHMCVLPYKYQYAQGCDLS